MGINSIRDSKIINLIIFDFSKPRILKTRFWYNFKFPITLTAFEITISPIIITTQEIKMLTTNNLFKNNFVLLIYSDTLIYVIVGSCVIKLLKLTNSTLLNFTVDKNSWGIFEAYFGNLLFFTIPDALPRFRFLFCAA